MDNSETVLVERQEINFNSATDLVCTIDSLTANATNSYVGQNVVQFGNITARNTLFEGYIKTIDLPNSTFTLELTSGKLQNQLELRDATSSLVNNFGRVVSTNQDYLEFYQNLPQQPQYVTYTINNKRIVEGVSRAEVSCYDYEQELNESKRLIKIIKKEYYGQIQGEFISLTRSAPGFLRRLV